RNRRQGPSIMGFEDEVEQSLQRPCRQTKRQVQADMRTHPIHRPARDIIHRSVELEFPSIGFDPVEFSCCCRGLSPGPTELGAVHPDNGMDRPRSNRVNGNAAEAQLIRERERAMTDILTLETLRARTPKTGVTMSYVVL